MKPAEPALTNWTMIYDEQMSKVICQQVASLLCDAPALGLLSPPQR